MNKKVISTSNAPAAIGPYSQAIVTGDFIFTSGQIPIDPQTNELIQDDIKKATRQVLNNLKEVLRAADSDLGSVIKTVIYLTNMSDFAAVNEVYGEFFVNETPARSCVAVAALPKNAMVEIEAVARKNK